MALGAGRAALGGAVLAAPVAMVRQLGLDAATANRMSWLTQMAAARDIVIGAGTLASAVRRNSASGWLLAGAAADLADAAVLGSALRQRRVGGVAAVASVASAVGAAALGAWAAAPRRS